MLQQKELRIISFSDIFQISYCPGHQQTGHSPAQDPEAVLEQRWTFKKNILANQYAVSIADDRLWLIFKDQWKV